MYYFGKDFTKETEIPSLLEDFLKKKQMENQKRFQNFETAKPYQTF